MTENESLLEYCERAVKTCVEECGGACSLRIKECECVDANVLKHLRELEQYRAIGTIEEFKDLKVKNSELHNEVQAINATMSLFEQEIRNKAIDEFANFIHEKAKENNGLRLSSETRSWTHACIFDYVNEFKESQMKGGE